MNEDEIKQHIDDYEMIYTLADYLYVNFNSENKTRKHIPSAEELLIWKRKAMKLLCLQSKHYRLCMLRKP